MFALLRLFMRGRAELREKEALVEYIPPSLTKPLNWDEVFPRRAPIEIDLGCGDGAFLIAMARANPEHNFLGIERLLGRVSKVCRKVAGEDLKNARVLRLEVAQAVSNLLPAHSIAAFHLLFPDPWPKRRHHRRRAFTTEFLSRICRALIADGLFHIATDHAEYFHQIERVIAAADTFIVLAGQHDFPLTTFEQKFLMRGISIQRLLLRKSSPVK
ncbi:MAG TPA: tRNA (guanosine(46)-N7)-methyltransferase TrmB [Chthoniobacterales bacterium]|nr:tRNA (guanosine(46)-N7)-methyltransferase TrmB [Chthoniobacterales bacterium]